ncbi:hypothetical protein [Fulvivirga lutimaris]|uniref:hypothetical protein n=1 Tax=Fulvivirga lutimaris TaxID=1819566 RepID=UPI0012BC9D61|nr:hypothetical protein [Fulvivirga lutimaris]MTI41452.1 hypothetical protein [Fulvivirga lutimaris]
MGYMGFGMRKEVYSRKPKEAFKKLKQVHGEKPKKEKGLDDSEYLELKQYRKSRFRHFYESKIFKVLSSGIIVASVLVLMWVFGLSTYYLNYKQEQFDKHGIIEYYESKKDDLNLIESFFSARRKKIESVDEGFLGYQALKVKSIDIPFSYHIDSINLVNYNTSWTDKVCSIKHSTLIITGKGFVPKSYPKLWLLDILFSKPKPINPSILNYLDSDWDELSRILLILKNNNWTVSTKENYIRIGYEHPTFRQYNIMFSKSSLNEFSDKQHIEGYTLKSGTIVKDGVYWTRFERNF